MPKDNGKIRSEYLLAALMCIAVAFFLTILIVSNSCSVDSPKGDTSSTATSSDSGSSESSEESASSEQPKPVKVERVPLAAPASTAEGVLVPVPDPEALASASSGILGGSLTNIYSSNAKQYATEAEHPYGYSGVGLELREDALKALNAMVTAFHTTKGGKTRLIVEKANVKTVSSGDQQAVEENLAGGCSVLLSVYPADPDGDYLGSGKFLWLADNCTNYGYILRYPAEKSDSTHQNGNTRLYRYVGYEHAAYMGQYHLSLEEYLDTLRNYTSVDAPLEIVFTDADGNERTCEVYYVSAPAGQISELPIRGGEGTEFTYTGNGSDGIIVTCFTN